MFILQEVKSIYSRMNENKIPAFAGNLMIHVVRCFCLLQKRDGVSVWYDNLSIGRDRVNICNVEVDGELEMCIITIPETTKKDTYMKWLRNYINKTNASRGIAIKGTLWNMVDTNELEYSVDLSDDNITEEDFERFLIIRKEKFMKKYNNDVMKAVRQSMGLDDENDTSKDKEIMSMGKEEVFERYCKYNGLLGCWYRYLMEAIESIYGVKLGQ